LTDLLITKARRYGEPATDITIRGGHITAIGGSRPTDLPIHDAGNRIALPGLVEAHTHLDKNMLGMPWYANEVGPRLIDKIDNERAERRRLGIEPARQSARQAAQTARFGATHIRTHVDVDTEVGVTGIEGVAATQAALRGIIDIEIVAFPQSGLLVRPGTLELMDAAMRAGGQVVGGLDPCAIDRDPKGHLDAIFGLATKYGAPVDIHLHEPGEMGAFSMELIIERTLALSLQGRVTISHAFCLGMPDDAAVGVLIEGLHRAGIAILTTAPASRPVPAVKRLAAAGIVVAAGSDGMRDTWGPYGNGDMLERAMLVGLRNNLRRDDELCLALDTVTTGGAAMLGLPDYGLAVGCHADLLLVEAETVAEAVVGRPTGRTTIKAGRITAHDGALRFNPPA
jgi:cytosine deaminase